MSSRAVIIRVLRPGHGISSTRSGAITENWFEKFFQKSSEVVAGVGRLIDYIFGETQLKSWALSGVGVAPYPTGWSELSHPLRYQ